MTAEINNLAEKRREKLRKKGLKLSHVDNMKLVEESLRQLGGFKKYNGKTGDWESLDK
jgi:hypothetical protein